MIGHIRGILEQKQPPLILIDVGGVGYEIEAPMSTFYVLPETGSEVTLVTHLAVREDAHTLYGFAHEDERRMFRSLIKISGVGAKLALTILSGISIDGLILCVENKDVASLTKLPGIGKKTAERLLVELSDRIKDWGHTPSQASDSSFFTAPAASSELGDAIGALVALGYKAQEAERMVKSIDTTDLASEEIIRQALQSMVRT